MTNNITSIKASFPLIAGAATLAFVLFSAPFLASAATYNYVNTSGGIGSVTANSAAEAMAAAPNIASHSGVALVVDGTGGMDPVVNPISTPIIVNQGASNQYAYVNTSGVVVVITASSAAMASSNAINIAPHSGVMLLNSNADVAIVGDVVVR